MPHDANGNLLEVGHLVNLPARVVEVQPGEDYCNITVESIHGRKPDGQKERVCAINAAVLEAKVEAAPDVHVMKVVQEALPAELADKAPEGACVAGGLLKSITDGHDFLHALATGNVKEFFAAHGVELAAAPSYQQIVAMAKLVCGVAVPVCNVINNLPSDAKSEPDSPA